MFVYHNILSILSQSNQLSLHTAYMRGSRNFCQGGGGPGQSDKKSSDVFFFLVLSLFDRSQMVNFKVIYHFSRFQRGSNIFQGGGSNCLFSIETHITCDFPGGVWTPSPLPPPPPPPPGSAIGLFLGKYGYWFSLNLCTHHGNIGPLRRPNDIRSRSFCVFYDNRFHACNIHCKYATCTINKIKRHRFFLGCFYFSIFFLF